MSGLLDETGFSSEAGFALDGLDDTPTALDDPSLEQDGQWEDEGDFADQYDGQDEEQYEAEPEYEEPQYRQPPPRRRPPPPQYEEPQYDEPAPVAAPVPVDPRLTEAQTRLKKAQLYERVLDGSLFNGANQAETEVENEFREFARFRLNDLLGVESAAGTGSVAGAFTPMEVKVLKAIAGDILNNATLRKKVMDAPAAAPKAKPAKPVVAAPAVVPAAKPTPKPPAPKPPPPRPLLRPRQQPVGARPRQLPPAPRPQRRPPPRQYQQQPRYQQQRPPQRRPQYQDQYPQQRRPAGPARVPQDGEITQLKGKPVKIVWQEMHPGEYGMQAERKLERTRPGTAVKLFNGIQVMKTTGGEYFKILHKDIAKQVETSARIPMPDTASMEAVTAARASQAVSSFSSVISRVANAAIAQE